jgi:hypothetical protein
LAIDTRSAHRPCISHASISRYRSRSLFIGTWPLFCCITSSSFNSGLVTNCVALCHAMAQFLVTWFAGVCVSFAQVYVRRSSNTLIVTVKLIWRRGLIFNPTRPLHYVHPGLIPSLSRTTSSRTPNWVCYFKIHCSHQEQSGAVTFASNVTCALPAFARKTPSELTYASALYHTLAIAAHVVLHEVHEASKRRRFCGRKCITRTKASVASLPTTKQFEQPLN